VTKRDFGATGSVLRGAGSADIGCYFINLRGYGSAHAVAMQNQGVRGRRFFDATAGCFWAKSDEDFQEFIDWSMFTVAYDMKFDKSVEIVGVNPPPYVLGGFGPGVANLIKPLGG
jgi:hypothetical protein